LGGATDALVNKIQIKEKTKDKRQKTKDKRQKTKDKRQKALFYVLYLFYPLWGLCKK
jgi:hypothetical protein